ncbi:MAG: cell wall hydrolase [Hyphomonadaceae bacterium]|nr:cell wall hydrolase [Hyphomonadaceae bacterium]
MHNRPRRAGWRERLRQARPHIDALGNTIRTLGAAGALAIAAVSLPLAPEARANIAIIELEHHPTMALEPLASLAPPALDDYELRLLAATAWGEARSEGELGMRAVAHVIVNRVGTRFGETVERVIRAPWQFSVWNRGDPNRRLVINPERYATAGSNLETWQIAQRVAREVLSGQSVDPTNGALFYHTTAIRPWWSRYGVDAHTIGAHIFYRDVPDDRQARPQVTHAAQTFGGGLPIDEPGAQSEAESQPGDADAPVAVNAMSQGAAAASALQ